MHRYKSFMLTFGAAFIILGSAQAQVPPELRGSPASHAQELLAAKRAGYAAYHDSRDLTAATARGELVPIEDADGYMLDDTIGEMVIHPDYVRQYRQARPQVKRFLDDLASSAGKPPGTMFKITSLVRTKIYQELLQGRYANAAEDSTHLTGAVVDISAKDMPRPVRAWLRRKLVSLEKRGLVLATEETGRGGTRRRVGSACFHVMVLPQYPKQR